MRQPLELMLKQGKEESENTADSEVPKTKKVKADYTGIIFSNYVLGITKGSKKLETVITYQEMFIPNMDKVGEFLKEHSKTVSLTKNSDNKSIVLRLSVETPDFDEGKNKILDCLKRLHENFSELKLDDAICNMSKLDLHTFEQCAGNIVADSSMITHSDGLAIKFYKREGPFVDSESDYIALMKEEHEYKLKSGKKEGIFSKGLPSPKISSLLQEAMHYLNRSYAFFSESGRFKEDKKEFEKRLINAYHDAERSVRIAQYTIENSIDKPFPDLDISCRIIMQATGALSQRAFCAEELFKLKNNYSAAIRFLSKTNDELEKFCVYLTKEIEKEEKEAMEKEDSDEYVFQRKEEENEEDVFDKAYEELIDAQTSLMEEISDLEKEQAYLMRTHDYKPNSLTIDEIPFFQKISFIKLHDEFLESGPAITVIQKQMHEKSDYLGFLSSEGFIF